ncbi:MAG: hypothetical protein ABS52_07805 [Gemmatimonadetes bacterium SCN 70-22]|nr:MAG: hypothetical protein ABS52_07805 [Gemmatimonadetes bacterium SCN 70-22]
MSAALEHVARQHRRRHDLNDEQLVADVVDYWFGGLDGVRLRALIEAMTNDRRVSRYVLEIGAALQHAGVIHTEDEAVVLEFRPRSAPFVPETLALASSSTSVAAPVELLDSSGYRLKVYVARGVIAATLALGNDPPAPVADAKVTLLRLATADDATRTSWEGRTDASGTANLHGEAHLTAPSGDEYYVFRVTLPEEPDLDATVAE